MFSILPLLVSTQVVAALAAPLLETINPALVTSNVHFGTSFLNSTALMEADASARVTSLADVQSVDSSHVSLLTPQRHASACRIQFNSNPVSDSYHRNTTIGEIEDVEYTVPGTQTTLHVSFREDRPLHRRSMGGYLLLIQDEVQAHINASGDGWLLPEDDPYQRKWPGSYSGTLNLISQLIGVCKDFTLYRRVHPCLRRKGNIILLTGSWTMY